MLRVAGASADEWEAASKRAVVPLRVERMAQRFRGDLARQELGDGMAVVRARSRAHELHRTSSLIADSGDTGVLLELNISGSTQVEQHRRAVVIRANEGVLYDTRHPYRLTFPTDNESMLLQVPRERLPITERALAEVMARPLNASMPEWVLLRGYAAVAWPAMRDATPNVASLIASTLGDLAVAAVQRLAGGGTTRPISAVLPGLRREVEQNLADPQLSPTSLAASQGISVRSVYSAFARMDRTPAGYIRERRIDRARSLLAGTDLRVVDVAAMCGFSETSTFVRAFRRSTGITPSEYRADRRTQHP